MQMNHLRMKKLVQSLVFTRPIVIDQERPIGTADLSLPFNMLGGKYSLKKQLVEAAAITPKAIGVVIKGLFKNPRPKIPPKIPPLSLDVFGQINYTSC